MSTLIALVRHPVSSVAATAVDFGIMIALVSGAGLPPSAGTASGAACGAAVNFALGRWWVFRARRVGAAGQASRYALVSFGSLVLNALGVHLLAEMGHVPYVAARVVVAVAVSFAWNFVLHRFFVFGVSDS
jgi:putative flippase GtrA